MGARVLADYHALKEELHAHCPGGSVVLTNGCFDLLHVGHVRLIQAAAREGDVLVVALNSDESVRASKGEGRPMIPLAERMELIAALVGVDYVTSFPEPSADELIRCLRPTVYVKGTDWTPETIPERATADAVGARVTICGDEKSHSSTELGCRSWEETTGC